MNAKTLLEELTKNGLTQLQIARATGIKQPNISYFLHGKRQDMFSQRMDALRALHAHISAGKKIEEFYNTLSDNYFKE